ncbi:MAG TPA: AAA family ATPase [Patescibacteria group bacterium]|nr:AAA family ATPase [Patescibacteria group bacterium]
MYLSKLEIQGFKSFAEKTVLEFNQELTAIVGPNGSGKSNTADAVRWVLGEQSMKTLRGKKTQDVIFSGSSKKASLGFAEVNLYLDNTDGSAPLDYREIVITRRIYRNGESEYLMNKNKVRLTDVQLMLAKSNFGQRSYSIIGQGMIDSVLTSSPAERKELFDEATGVRQYQIKKDQAVLKLERSRENLVQSEQLIQEIEPRLRSLNRQVKRLERKEEIENSLNQLQTEYYSRLKGELKNKLAGLNDELNDLNKEKQRLETDIVRLEKAIDAEQIGDTEAGAFARLQSESQNLTAEKNRLTGELALINGKIDLDLTKAGKMDLVWLKNKLREVNEELLQTETRLKQQLTDEEKITKLLEIKQLEQKEVLDEFKTLREKLDAAQKNLSQTEKVSLAHLKEKIKNLYNGQRDFVEDFARAQNQDDLDRLKKKAGRLLEEIKDLSAKMEEAAGQTDQDIFALREKLNDFLTTKDSLVNEVQDLKLAMELARQKTESLEREKAKLSQEQAKLKNELGSFSTDSAEASQNLNQQKQTTEAKLKELTAALKAMENRLEKFSQDQAIKKNKFIEVQQNLRGQQFKLNSHNLKINEVKIELAKAETRLENLAKEILNDFVGQFKELEQLPKIDASAHEAEIARLKNQLAVIGGIDDEVLEEFKEVRDRHAFLSEQTIDLRQAIESCEQLIDELDEKITRQFEVTFNKINEKFQHYFKILFDGGSAKLILQKKEIIDEAEAESLATDSKTEEISAEKPAAKNKIKRIEYGIEIQATPPGKKLRFLNMLSGGEKALTSIALISAIIANNPSPFVILDEVDAALDEANSERFAKIVADLSDRTQFICITHNRATMHQAAILYGVTMGSDGVSKLLSVNLKEADQLAGE